MTHIDICRSLVDNLVFYICKLSQVKTLIHITQWVGPTFKFHVASIPSLVNIKHIAHALVNYIDCKLYWTSGFMHLRGYLTNLVFKCWVSRRIVLLLVFQSMFMIVWWWHMRGCIVMSLYQFVPWKMGNGQQTNTILAYTYSLWA